MIYLDYAAATPVDASVLAAMLPHFTDNFANPTSLHEAGRRARSVIDMERAFLAEELQVEPFAVIFTGSATESCNLAIRGLAMSNSMGSRKRILISAIEHSAVLDAANSLAEFGFLIELIPVDVNGFVDLVALGQMLGEDVLLVSIGLANNEIGVIQDLAVISKLVKGSGAYLHTDATQAAQFLPLGLADLGVDLLSFGGGKIYGPKGVGVLAMRERLDLQPIVYGGGQEFGLRSGTESVALIVGLCEAYRGVLASREMEVGRLGRLAADFLAKIEQGVADCYLTGNRERRLPNHLSFVIRDVEGESLLIRLSRRGVCVSTGSACSSGSLKPSHVLEAIGVSEADQFSSLRISMGRSTTEAELERFLAILVEEVDELRQL
jgi:cysteine desulfurase